MNWFAINRDRHIEINTGLVVLFQSVEASLEYLEGHIRVITGEAAVARLRAFIEAREFGVCSIDPRKEQNEI